MKKRVLAMCLGLGMLLCGCVHGGDVQVDVSGTSDVSTELGGTEDAFGESFSDAELYGHVPQKSDLTVTYVSGTKDCMCPSFLPLVAPQTLQVLGAVQVASAKEWDSAVRTHSHVSQSVSQEAVKLCSSAQVL